MKSEYVSTYKVDTNVKCLIFYNLGSCLLYLFIAFISQLTITDTINSCLATVTGKYENAFHFLYNHEALMYYIYLLIYFGCAS